MWSLFYIMTHYIIKCISTVVVLLLITWCLYGTRPLAGMVLLYSSHLASSDWGPLRNVRNLLVLGLVHKSRFVVHDATNSRAGFWLSDATRCQMSSAYLAPSYYRYKTDFFVNWTLRNTFQWNYIWNLNISFNKMLMKLSPKNGIYFVQTSV